VWVATTWIAAAVLAPSSHHRRQRHRMIQWMAIARQQPWFRVTTATAFPTTATTIRQQGAEFSSTRVFPQTTRTFQNSRSSLTMSSRDDNNVVNGDSHHDPNDNNDPKRVVGRTGWNHNEPAPNSDFWVPEGEQGREATSDDNDNPRDPPKLRTGWLHNQASPTAAPTTATAAATPENTKTPSLLLARQRLNQAMIQSKRNHRILSPVAFHSTSTQQVIAVTEHVIAVPLRHDRTPRPSPIMASQENKDDEETAAAKTTQQLQLTQKEEMLDLYFTVVETIGTNDDEKRAWLSSLQSLSPARRAQTYVQKSALTNAQSLCLYLQGGPGFGAAAPVAGLGFGSAASSWAAQALLGGVGGYQRVVLLDQRGTGKSTPITKQTLEFQFPDLFLLDDQTAVATKNDPIQLEELVKNEEDKDLQKRALTVQSAVNTVTEYLSCFRADSIVQDAELVREALLLSKPLGEEEEAAVNIKVDEVDWEGPKPWGGCLGQSFGGFCLMTYLSQVPNPPKICLFTGGIAPILSPLKDVYTQLWKRVQKRTKLYYEMYPGDVALVKKIVQRLLHEPAPLPAGGSLTARRFLQIGLGYLGSSPSSFAALHKLLSSAFVVAAADPSQVTSLEDIGKLQFHRSFLKSMEVDQSFDDAPIYYWMHESIYADGDTNAPTQWTAHRAYQDLVQGDAEVWDYRKTSSHLDNDDIPTLFFGEMVFPWMADGDYAELSGLGLKHVADSLANKNDWPILYDTDRMCQVLEAGSSRAAAAIYYDDFYVDFDSSMKVANGPMEKMVSRKRTRSISLPRALVN